MTGGSGDTASGAGVWWLGQGGGACAMGRWWLELVSDHMVGQLVCWLGLAGRVVGGRLEQRPGDVPEVIVDGSLGWWCLHGDILSQKLAVA